jgi:hypothetical protein
MCQGFLNLLACRWHADVMPLSVFRLKTERISFHFQLPASVSIWTRIFPKETPDLTPKHNLNGNPTHSDISGWWPLYSSVWVLPNVQAYLRHPRGLKSRRSNSSTKSWLSNIPSDIDLLWSSQLCKSRLDQNSIGFPWSITDRTRYMGRRLYGWARWG